MTDKLKTGANQPDQMPGGAVAPLRQSVRPPPPGLAAIALYLLLLAGVIILGVAAGRHYPPLFLLFAAFFIAASAGLLLQLRWAWAMTLAAVFLLAIYYVWIFTTQHQVPAVVQGLLNLVFFLYVVRTEVREKLR